ncbi:MAG: hypothetical protein A3B34_04125 [Candidatus Sungbacteria bacterium RIFCSPLOWO2_01_FULL_54_21]|uniref:Methyltransferase type 11 domain-containing protein n=2 Tax=Candidatus Sungiibacteriota TaxID=1817917 RepID=A0A1G2L916_9BACT|nr:MAG: hypothetical protein A2679_00835 [Candidatus Sungbacteria bacterium RIFCSPHIGHO2_01_FULL_54_26]OHA03835.1 MAG: hypothetical protein A3C92_04025 [Candidatus Sungbacteria bacterium RIFCSPHIGHO2_02_FULL_53_17]OHA08136.1 MAG: hypothetical protein A3B34_04125 [Candidatus Sungbacteria bacterium RIFCSPLOWO2_01_FULL_54_21]
MTTANTSRGNNFLEPAAIVTGFGLRRGDHAADFGAGHGFFALAMARATGREGKVWAVDVQKSALDIVRSRAMAEHMLNLEYLCADLEESGSSGLPERFMDFVLIGNMLFQAEQRGEILREAWRCLRSGGRLAMIEWDVPLPTLRDVSEQGTSGTMSEGTVRSTASNIGSGTQGRGTTGDGVLLSTNRNIGSGTLGPPAAQRLKKQDAKALATGAGFELDREFSAGPHHYGLLFVKK